MKKMKLAACLLAFAALTACHNNRTENSQANNRTNTTAPASVSKTVAPVDKTGTTSDMDEGVSVGAVEPRAFYGKSASNTNNNVRINRPVSKRPRVKTNRLPEPQPITITVDNSDIGNLERPVNVVHMPIGVYNDQPGFGPSRAIGPRGLPNNMYTTDGLGGTYKGDISDHMDGVNSVR